MFRVSCRIHLLQRPSISLRCLIRQMQPIFAVSVVIGLHLLTSIADASLGPGCVSGQDEPMWSSVGFPCHWQAWWVTRSTYDNRCFIAVIEPEEEFLGYDRDYPAVAAAISCGPSAVGYHRALKYIKNSDQRLSGVRIYVHGPKRIYSTQYTATIPIDGKLFDYRRESSNESFSTCESSHSR